jgi:hypothetical protein
MPNSVCPGWCGRSIRKLTREPFLSRAETLHPFVRMTTLRTVDLEAAALVPVELDRSSARRRRARSPAAARDDGDGDER